MTKTTKINWKRQIRGTPIGIQPAFACQTALKSLTKMVNTVFFLFIFRHFFLISGMKSLEKVYNEQKRLKTVKNSV